MMADLLETAGSTNALTWRIRTAKLAAANVTNRFAWAQTALREKNLKSAAEAMGGVGEPSKSLPEYHKIAGALAWEQGRSAEAENQYEEALRLEPANQANILNLETIHLASTNRDVTAAACLTLEKSITNAALRPVALHHLLTFATAHHDLDRAVGYARELATNSTATVADKIECLQLLRTASSGEFVPWLTSLKTAALQSAPQAFALGQWLIKAENPATALRWLHTLPPETQTNQPVPLVITDCLIALKDWPGLLACVDKQDWAGADFYRQAVVALAHRSLGQNATSETAWRKALHLAAHQPERLSRLAQVAETWGWAPEKTELLRQLTEEFPEDKWAVNQLTAQYYAEGNTAALQKLLEKFHAADPSDVRIENNLASILLLRKSEVEQANSLARAAYETDTNNPFFICTYAYSLSLQKKTGEALKVLDNLKPEHLKIPTIAAYYGVIQAQSGHKDLALVGFARAEKAGLLPEEKEMIRQAKARL
jgi:predicted Zn-dependent protease